MSKLGDLIVEHGEFEPGECGFWVDAEDVDGGAADVNALRDELIELRADRAELEILRPAAHARSAPLSSPETAERASGGGRDTNGPETPSEGRPRQHTDAHNHARCVQCGGPRDWACVDTTTWADHAQGRTTCVDGRWTTCERCGSTQRPERVAPALRPGEGQHRCFLADRCVQDPRCEIDSAACTKREDA